LDRKNHAYAEAKLIAGYIYLHDILRRLLSMTNRQIKNIIPKACAASRNTAWKDSR